MPLEPGVRLGVDQIVSAIGAGGMGEVYRAHDSALDRDVAIKVLPDTFAADAAARFALANGLTPEQVIRELPDLELPDTSACLRLASRRVDHPIVAA